MSESNTPQNSPLGQSADYDAPYDPGLLFGISRAPGRRALGIEVPPFRGCDIWNVYELSWLNARGLPQVAWAELRIPAETPSIVESKSLKLYFNSFNQTRFADIDTVVATIRRDVAACVGAPIEVAVRLPAQWPAAALAGPEGLCLDDQDIDITAYTPAPECLVARPGPAVERRCFSRLLRSRCPVTGQPDWGSVLIDYAGPEIEPAGLLRYIVSFRQHQDFHEHCIERMFCDIRQHCAPTRLTVAARYLRRGGIDINPWRSTEVTPAPNERLFLQ